MPTHEKQAPFTLLQRIYDRKELWDRKGSVKNVYSGCQYNYIRDFKLVKELWNVKRWEGIYLCLIHCLTWANLHWWEPNKCQKLREKKWVWGMRQQSGEWLITECTSHSALLRLLHSAVYILPKILKFTYALAFDTDFDTPNSSPLKMRC